MSTSEEVLLSTLFNFTSFKPNTPAINFSGDAFASGDNTVQLTRNQLDNDLRESAGWATYTSPVQLWDATAGTITDFCTHFTFIINGLNKNHHGDGLAFFIAASGSVLPINSTGEWLGLFNSTTSNSSSAGMVAVEFDTYKNEWDPDDNHIGVNVNSIVSVKTKTWKANIRNGTMGSAWIGYNSTGKNLYVFLTYNASEVYIGVPSLSYNVNLKEILTQEVIVGFSASTGASTELHKILSWDFASSMGLGDAHSGKLSSDPKKPKWVFAFVVAFAVLLVGLGFGVLYSRFKRHDKGEEKVPDASIENKLVKIAGPKRFSYKELASATNNFNEEGKLGQGGFGEVYKGKLSKRKHTIETVAVKKISRGSQQGRKEYVSEITVISQLRHRNLVKLIGWCHENKELLMVYEFMPNGSLDAHLFGKKPSILKWAQRYKISQGLASALLYLHEECEQCVVHRDIKSSNVMLDSNFNAKLGDFGLARLLDHSLGSQTTVLAGTMGYVAPECVTTGKASKDSDVYSFGMVALEIACGRKPVMAKVEDPKMVRLVEWVWGLYGSNQLLQAADKRLAGEFDEKQMERLMVVGLWCAHPDHTARPSIRQVIKVLKVEAPLPKLPAEMPVATYYVPHLCMRNFAYIGSFTGKSWTTVSSGADVPCCCSNCKYASPTSASSGDSVAKTLMKKSDNEKNDLQHIPNLLR